MRPTCTSQGMTSREGESPFHNPRSPREPRGRSPAATPRCRRPLLGAPPQWSPVGPWRDYGGTGWVGAGGPGARTVPCYKNDDCNDKDGYLGPCIAGDGGETFAELTDLLDAGSPFRHLPGLVYQENGGVVFNGARATSEFSKPPRFEDLDMDKYRQAGFGIGVLTKLGDFSYPTASSAEDPEISNWRVVRPIQKVVHEVKDMEERFGLRKVFFIDSGFNVPLDHAKSLCQALMDADLKLHWNTCLAPFSCDTELVGMMKQAGCALVLMGGLRGDSHDGETLGERLESVVEVCRMCEEGDLHYTIAQSFGEPEETRETVEDKLAFLRMMIQLNFCRPRISASLTGTVTSRQ